MTGTDNATASKNALECIAAMGLEPTPMVYEIFYLVQMGENRLLSDAFETMVRKNGRLTVEKVAVLHEQFVQSPLIQEVFSQFGDRLSESVDRVKGITESAASDQAEFGNAMGKIGTLVSSITDPRKLVTIVASIVKAATSMQSRSKASSDRLLQLEGEIAGLQEQVSAIQRDAETDQLTGVGNRRRFDTVYAKEFAKASQERSALTVVMIDVDHFKKFNDRWGHVTGDAVLRQIARILQGRMAHRGVVCRYGGEEFAAILPGVNSHAAAAVVEEIRTLLSRTPITRRDTNEQLGHVTASFGIAERRPNDTEDALVERADAHLYEAKGAGRNRIMGDHGTPSISRIVDRVQTAVSWNQEGAGPMRAAANQ